jgi:LIM domain
MVFVAPKKQKKRQRAPCFPFADFFFHNTKKSAPTLNDSDASVMTYTDSEDEVQQLALLRQKLHADRRSPRPPRAKSASNLSQETTTTTTTTPVRLGEGDKTQTKTKTKTKTKEPSSDDELQRLTSSLAPAPPPPKLDLFDPNDSEGETDVDTVQQRAARDKAVEAERLAREASLRAQQQQQKQRELEEEEEAAAVRALQQQKQRRMEEAAQRERDAAALRARQVEAQRQHQLAADARLEKQRIELQMRQNRQEKQQKQQKQPEPVSESTLQNFDKLELLRDLVMSHVRTSRNWLVEIEEELGRLSSVAQITRRKDKYRALLEARAALEDSGEEFPPLPRAQQSNNNMHNMHNMHIQLDAVGRAKFSVEALVHALAAKLKDMLLRVATASRAATLAVDAGMPSADQIVTRSITIAVPVAQAVRELSRVVEEQSAWELDAEYGSDSDSDSPRSLSGRGDVYDTSSTPPRQSSSSSSLDSSSEKVAPSSLDSLGSSPMEVAMPEPLCCGCSRPLGSGEFVTAEGEDYHPDCFACSHCHRKIGGRFATGRLRGKKEIFCEDHAHFASPTTYCFDCQDPFKPGDRIFSVDGHRIHDSCFVCERCLKPLSNRYVRVGDRRCCDTCGDALVREGNV